MFHLEAVIFLISPIHTHRLIYAHSLCFTPSSSDKRGAMMELSWLHCSRVSLPLPRSSSSQHWKLRDRFWVIIPKIHAVYGQVMLFLPTVHSSSLPFLFLVQTSFFSFLKTERGHSDRVSNLSFSYRLKDFLCRGDWEKCLIICF